MAGQKYLFNYLIFTALIALILTGCSEPPLYNTDALVHVRRDENGFTLMRNGAPFHIQGVAGQEHLALLEQIGGNTIRTYDTVGLRAVLDSAHAHNLAVIVGIDLPVSTESWFYENDSLVEAFNRDLQGIVGRYKDHPAVLMWCLGNELIFYDWLEFNFSSVYNRFLHTIQQLDPNHPVTTATANFSDRAIVNWQLKIPDIDIYLINTFGRLPKLKADMKPYTWLWEGPYIIGEFGESGPWETEFTAWGAPLEMSSGQKAQRLMRDYQQNLPHDDPRFMGALAFYWGQRQEVTHTWFNFFDAGGLRSAPVYTLAQLWQQPLAGNRPPEIESFELDNSREYNRFLFKPGSTHGAQILAIDPDQDSLQIEWSLRPEDWFFRKFSPPVPAEGLWMNDSLPPWEVQFKAPGKPGPYRLYARVTDGQGHFSVTNLPFYVVQ